jgi:hypothetical protein
MFDNRLSHLVVKNTAISESYTSPAQYPRPRWPERSRGEHASHLLSQLQAVQKDSQDRKKLIPVGIAAPEGIYLEVEGKPGFDLNTKSLDFPSKGIELLSVKEIVQDGSVDVKTVATIYVPDDQVTIFIKKIEQYRDELTKKGNPKNNSLVSSIENIRLAIIKSLWTDLSEVFPNENEFIWWEVWLRASPDAVAKFRNFAKDYQIILSHRSYPFQERHVLLAYSSANKLSDAIDFLDLIAELRLAKETTDAFLQMSNFEKNEWIKALTGLLNSPSEDSPVVCILDSGITKKHPLIDPFLLPNKLLSCDFSWGVHDHHGHGTEMAGLVLYGDLNRALENTTRINIPCELESVKIFPPANNNQPDVYGSITEEAIKLATDSDVNRQRTRIICMAVTATDDRDRGQPSSWSAAIDNISMGVTVNSKQHLFIISAGNSDKDGHINYPHANLTDNIHDPGQSWNALTVGAYTEKGIITDPDYKGWTPLAEIGDIAPGTTTSVAWQKGKWPIKPDIVFEGGNAARDPDQKRIDYPNSLALLTTGYSPLKNMFSWTADTSAATAQVCHFAAHIAQKYPEFWPETVRGLIVHSASWTDRMRTAYPCNNKNNRENILRMCGYGVPNLEKALWSASNVLTLIIQDELRPFDKNNMNEMNIHTIPWPVEVLQSLGEAAVTMRVTLSYFIEPNPARRGWQYKFQYQSHGLRFDVKTPEESSTEFVTRLNKERWDEEQGKKSVTSAGDSSEWFFGKQIRSKGSLHSDYWEGTAASLAGRNQIAIFPVMGWWREKYADGHTEKRARYSLIVTIDTPDVAVDIYTPVKNQVVTEVSI